MDLHRIIRELIRERDRVQRIIESLEEAEPSGALAIKALGKRREESAKSERSMVNAIDAP